LDGKWRRPTLYVRQADASGRARPRPGALNRTALPSLGVSRVRKKGRDARWLLYEKGATPREAERTAAASKVNENSQGAQRTGRMMIK
jgi:hypothetical protein